MTKIIGPAIPNMPWEDRKKDGPLPFWKFSGNPVIGRDGNAVSNSVFNSAVVPFEDGFAGVFRCDSRSVSMDIFAGFSKDGLNWEIDDTPINLVPDESIEDAENVMNREYRYDPRVIKIEDKYYVNWCNGYHGPTIGVAWTKDFKTFHQMENAYLPYNRNGVLFPRKINGRYMMLSRPSDTGHTPFGDIFVSQSEDLTYWGRHRYVMGAVKGDTSAWQSLKIGPGPVPIETDEGWLVIYHGVINTANGYVYRVGSAILDIDEPWKVLYRSKDYVLAPHELYEMAGDVPNVTFPCAVLADSETGRIAMYYGAADTVTALAFTTVEELVQYTKNSHFEE